MRDYLIRLLAVMLIASVGEMFLPQGNIRKYATVLLSMIVCCALLSPFGGNIAADVDVLSTYSEIDDTYDSEVITQYKKRTENYIEQKSGVKVQVTTDEQGNITHIRLLGGPQCDTGVLAQELGVTQDEIEILNE